MTRIERKARCAYLCWWDGWLRAQAEDSRIIHSRKLTPTRPPLELHRIEYSTWMIRRTNERSSDAGGARKSFAVGLQKGSLPLEPAFTTKKSRIWKFRQFGGSANQAAMTAISASALHWIFEVTAANTCASQNPKRQGSTLEKAPCGKDGRLSYISRFDSCVSTRFSPSAQITHWLI